MRTAKHKTLDVTVTLTWDEDYPGWVAKGEARLIVDDGDEANTTRGVGIQDLRVPPQMGNGLNEFNPVAAIAWVIDKLARDANIHPDNVGQVAIHVDSGLMLECARRLRL